MKRPYIWIVFAIVQASGFVLPLFANVHSDPLPLFGAVALLFPGSLIGLIFSSVPNWVLVVAIASVNGVAWFLVSKCLGKLNPAT